MRKASATSDPRSGKRSSASNPAAIACKCASANPTFVRKTGATEKPISSAYALTASSATLRCSISIVRPRSHRHVLVTPASTNIMSPSAIGAAASRPSIRASTRKALPALIASVCVRSPSISSTSRAIRAVITSMPGHSRPRLDATTSRARNRSTESSAG